MTMDPQIKASLITLLITSLTGVCIWAGVTVRKATRNLGRTDEEIALAEYQQALEAERIARASDDPNDDAVAEKIVALAKRKLDAKKKWRAITDAVGDVE